MHSWKYHIHWIEVIIISFLHMPYACISCIITWVIKKYYCAHWWQRADVCVYFILYWPDSLNKQDSISAWTKRERNKRNDALMLVKQKYIRTGWMIQIVRYIVSVCESIIFRIQCTKLLRYGSLSSFVKLLNWKVVLNFAILCFERYFCSKCPIQQRKKWS